MDGLNALHAFLKFANFLVADERVLLRKRRVLVSLNSILLTHLFHLRRKLWLSPTKFASDNTDNAKALSDSDR